MSVQCRVCGFHYYAASHVQPGKSAATCLPCHTAALFNRLNAVTDDIRTTWNATVGTPNHRRVMNVLYCRRRRAMRAIQRRYDVQGMRPSLFVAIANVVIAAHNLNVTVKATNNV